MSDPGITDWPRLSADQFIAWSMRQPEGEHFELYDGVVVRMPNDTSLHALAKARIAYRLMQAIEIADLPCQVYIDAMAVEIAQGAVFEPDILVRCGEPQASHAVKVTDPLIAIEILSSSSRFTDLGRKRDGYLSLPSVRHYLVVDADIRQITHFRRAAVTTIHGNRPLELEPPGLTIDRLFE